MIMATCEHGFTTTHQYSQKASAQCSGPSGSQGTCTHGRTSAHMYEYTYQVTCASASLPSKE
jgi:hypothetical protein